MEIKRTPKLLSDKPFNKDTYTVVHTPSSLNLNDIDKKHIDSHWKSFLKEAHLKGAKPFDGTFYRMENIPEIISGSKELALSTIKYSEVRALKDNPNLSNSLQANNIATASLIRTSDNFFVFGIRNSNSMSKSKIDLIGGGLQASELVVNNFSDIFRNQFKEIKEETGLTEKDIKDMHGIGIVQSSRSNVLFIFLTQLNRSKNDIENIFSNNNDDEMSGLEFIEEEFLEESLNEKGDYRSLVGELYFKNNI